MALHENLPIYKKALDMAVYFEKIVRNLSRYHKYTLGSEMRDLSKKIVILTVKANSQREKLPELLKIRDHLEELKVLIKIAKEVKAFKSFRSFEYSIRGVVEIANTYNLKQRLWAKFAFINRFFFYDGVKLRRRYKLPGYV